MAEMGGFMTYREAALLYRALPDEDAAAVIKATVEYYLTGEIPELTGTLAGVFEVMRLGVDRGRENWERRREHARKGAAARWGKADALPEDARALPEDANRRESNRSQKNPFHNTPSEERRTEGYGEENTVDPDFLERMARAKVFCREMEENTRRELGMMP